ncbi:MAG: hypothetical protein KF875_11535 [Trueperaceae bacterium]|jgi:uncharacterized membrane protein|nr:hypothetical protein [Trueperaceae bacterium]
MTGAADLVWLVVLVVSASVWLGGLLTMPVVARAASATLAPLDRVAFFRALGRAYLPVGGSALALALLSGAVLLRHRRWDGLLAAGAITAAALVVALALGVVQARRMTRLRQAAGAAPQDADLGGRVRRGGRSAVALRALIGLLSLALVVLGCLLLT